ncbi:MAG TPA: 30S ribosomal protein S20 [candidate division Zixibacteria bacterium]|nr:30S ribosomal protein S20 [candidate division Zixibacteria bacterium]
MPSHKSCAKRMKTSESARIRNRARRSELRSAIRDLRSETNKEQAAKKYLEVVSLLDRAAGYNLIHRKNADRNKSRLALYVQKLG